MKKRTIIALLALGSIAVGVVCWKFLRPVEPTEGAIARQKVAEVMKGYKTKRAGRNKSNTARSTAERKSPPIDIFADYKGSDRRIAEKLQAYLDDGDFKGVQRVYASIAKAENPDLRKDYISALAWFGAEALPELTELMLDSDEDVASEAMTQWTMALSEIEDCDRRMSVTFAAFGALTNEDALEFVGGELSGTALEYIDGEDDEVRQGEKRVEVVQALLDLIEGPVAVRAEFARAAYEDITGFEWRGVDEAENYLQSPDDYELPEDRDPEAEAERGDDNIPTMVEDGGEHDTENSDYGTAISDGAEAGNDSSQSCSEENTGQYYDLDNREY